MRHNRRKRNLYRVPSERREELNRISYPVKHSEFEVHAELYDRLRALGYDARGCVPARCRDDKGRQPRCHLDLVVFRERQPVVIIEVKNGNGTSFVMNDTQQARRYLKFGLPVIQCPNMNWVSVTVEKVQELCPQFVDPCSCPPLSDQQ